VFKKWGWEDLNPHHAVPNRGYWLKGNALAMSGQVILQPRQTAGFYIVI